MRVLGIDPAAAGATGYGVVETDGRRTVVLEYGVVPAARRRPARDASKGDDFPARLKRIHRQMAELVERHAPDAVAVEAVFTALNMRTALKLAEVRGVVLLAAAEREVPVHSYSPREVKASVAGHGDAGKHQIQQMVRAALGMAALPEPADAADALAVALCHIYAAAARERIARAIAGVNGAARSVRGSRSRSGTARIQPLR
jgi:crossover junction endodeoxyribonuclease RuvC